MSEALSAEPALRAPIEQPIGLAATSRLGRLAVGTAVIGLVVAAGIAFHIDANVYLLATLPLTVGFQLLIARRPLRALWLLDARPIRLDRVGVALVLGLAVVPALLVVAGVLARDVGTAAYGLVTLVGAVPAAYALRAMDAVARRALVRSVLTAGLVGVAVFVVIAAASGGPRLLSDPIGMLTVVGLSFLQYLPVVFVVEEVFFRGALDTYARGPQLVNDRWSALLVSALWGLWHLPLTFATAGFSQLPWLVGFHAVLGLLLTGPWRRSGNLAVPGITHALTDAIRNALLAV